MEFRILGPLQVVEGGRELLLGSPKERELMAVLLLNAGNVVSRDRLIDELWGESPPPTAAKALNVHVSQLRKALARNGHQPLVTQAPGYALRVEPERLDAREFERLLTEARDRIAAGNLAAARDSLREALALWRGRVLEGVELEAAARTEAARLEESRLAAHMDRIDCDLALELHEQVIGELEALVAEHPLRERLRGQLMLALYRSGRQADALRCYRDARETLVGELGIEPSVPLQRLERAILNHDPSLEAPSGVARTVPASETGAVRGRPPRPWVRERRVAVAGVTLLFAVAASAAAVFGTRGGSGPSAVQPNSVGVIDPDSGRVVAEVDVGAEPARLAFAAGSIWVANAADRTVSRVDPRTRRVLRTIPVGGEPRFLVPGAGGIWVDSLTWAKRIEPEFNAAGPAVALRTSERARSALALAAVRSAVWLPAGDGVTRIAPRTGHPEDSVLTGTDGPIAVAVGAGAVWAAQPTASAVVKVDRARTLTPIRLPDPPTDVAVGAGAVWAVTTGGLLIRIDPTTAAVAATIHVGQHPTAVVVGGGSVWVANSLDGTISQVDLRRDSVVATIRVGNSPKGLAWGDGKLWVTVQARTAPPPAAQAGGTLRIESQQTDLGGFDPALNYTAGGVQFDYATCLRLVNYRDTGGPAAPELTAEAATTLGARSGDARSYVFTIRKGFRFSPPSGEPVTAETFRYAIERALNPTMKSYAPAIFGDILGVRAFEAGKATHIRGVTVSGDRLTIRLSRGSRDFLQRLATQFFCAVPLGTPIDPQGVREIPSAGPYYVASERPGRVILKRNPNYRGDRPHRLAGIVLTGGVPQPKILADIESGKADYALDGVPKGALARLAVRYGPASATASGGRQRYFQGAYPVVQYLALNTHRALFRHRRLRQAVNYAIDRAALARLGAPSSDPSLRGPQLPTDHFLPPGFPGYREAHVYPLRPDRARARRLTRGLHANAVMVTCDLDVCRDIAQVVRANLRRVGIDVVITRLPMRELYARENAGRFDIGTAGWAADYADPANILGPLFDGRSIASGSNTSRFDEPAWNRRLRAAAPLTGRARARAYGNLDIALARGAAPAAAWSYATRGDFFSARVGCQIEQPVTYGVDLAALCIR